MTENNARIPINMTEPVDLNLKMESYTIIGNADAIYNQGFQAGEEKGFENGYSNGHSEGFNLGYQQAIQDNTVEQISEIRTVKDFNVNLVTSALCKITVLLESIDMSFISEKGILDFSYFFYYGNMESLKLLNFDASNITSLFYTFCQCTKLKSINTNEWNVSRVTNLERAFSNCSSIVSLDMNNWNTSQVTSMNRLFYYCSSMENLNMSGWNTSNVIDIGQAFAGCSKLKEVTFGNNWASNSNITSFEINNCPLSKESILDLANKIADKSDTSVYTGTYTVKLKSSQKSLFTEEELTALANQFTAKNWSLAWS